MSGDLRRRIHERMASLGIEAKRSLGQNFLVSDSVVEKILRAASEFAPKTIIEVGPGLGALTDGLFDLCENLVLIEYDRVLAEYWRTWQPGSASNAPNAAASSIAHSTTQSPLVVHEVDALKWDWNLSAYPRPLILVSNLPYQISSSLVVDRSVDKQGLDGMVLMFQKEVAQRMKARPATSEYGFLSVLAQTFWSLEMVLEAGPRDFFPAPKVASRVLSFNPRQVDLDREKYLAFLKACFLHPRKKMVSNLNERMGFTKDLVGEVLQGMKVDSGIRAQQLSLPQFVELFHKLCEYPAP